MFTFVQDEERDIRVHYYNGSISIEQGDNSILIETENFSALAKEIKKNMAPAKEYLDRRK